ncbi:DUF6086 family protein [Nocardioides carbamazepini]|uniref:DUF6086 family protein n=1 Tax=Nocardioides carbamazepini TaxID=2854259 RepID=UPI00214A566E|nr:DUF6086 family protein [Nocardioides carbamazepini]
MRFRFTTTPSDDVMVARSDEMPLFTDVLNDCIGTRTPRGAPPGLSTYWIDEALKEFRPHLGVSGASAIFSGNASYLEHVDGLVEARYDYDPPDSDIVERLPLQDLVDLLDAWRAEVILLDASAPTRMPPARPAIALGPPPKDADTVSQYFECDGVTLWSPATGSAQRFLAALRALEADAGEPAGFGPMESDECQIDRRAFDRFARVLVTSLQPDACGAVVLTVVALAERAGFVASWRPPPNKWEGELLDRARTAGEAAMAWGWKDPADAQTSRERFLAHACSLSNQATLEVTEHDRATTMRLRPSNVRSVGVVLHLGAGDHGTVALDDPACVPIELGTDSSADVEAIDYFVSVARDGRATAFRAGRGGSTEIRGGQQTSRSWRNTWPWPGWKRRADRVDYEPYC